MRQLLHINIRLLFLSRIFSKNKCEYKGLYIYALTLTDTINLVYFFQYNNPIPSGIKFHFFTQAQDYHHAPSAFLHITYILYSRNLFIFI